MNKKVAITSPLPHKYNLDTQRDKKLGLAEEYSTQRTRMMMRSTANPSSAMQYVDEGTVKALELRALEVCTRDADEIRGQIL